MSIRSSADKATYESGLKSFIAEARLLAQFDHPSLVKVYRFWEANNTAYMVMPLYSGVTLKQARSQMAAPPSEAWLRTVLWSILQALRVLHKNKTLHRDVSPDNIFLQDMGPPVLLDLGAARRAISDKSHRLTAILKVNYAPIEQYAEAEDLQQGPWTDLYSLAAVVYTCLRNDPPLPATSRVVRDRLPTLASVVLTVQAHLGQSYSEKFVSAISHALAVQPADRPQSVQELIDEMALEPVEELARFDWRADMGAQLLPATADISRSQWVTQSQTIPAERQSAGGGTGADQDVTLAPAPRRAAKSARKSRKMIVLPVAILVVTAVLGFWIIRANDVVGGAPLVVAPEPAAAPVVAGPAPNASEPQALASLPVIPTPSTVIHEPATTPVPVRPVAPERRVKAASAEPKKERTDTPRAAETSMAQPVRKPVNDKPAAVKNKAKSDKVLCADKNFFFRPICIHEECKKPENAQLEACIEDHKRYPAESGTVRP